MAPAEGSSVAQDMSSAPNAAAMGGSFKVEGAGPDTSAGRSEGSVGNQKPFSPFGWIEDLLNIGCPCGTRDDSQSKISIDRSSSLWSEVIGAAHDPCGVGITFRYNAYLQLFEVQSLIAGGPAATSGEVLEGDVLMSAGGTDTSAIPLPELARLLIGPEGSEVTLHFRRPVAGSVEGAVETFAPVSATLTRRPVETLLDTQATPRKLAYSSTAPYGRVSPAAGSPNETLPQAAPFGGQRAAFVGRK